jgi:MFS family permease
LKIRRSSNLILAASVAILLIALGLRASFGLFLQPMSVDNGWTRDVFSMAFAIQSIVWGLGAPVFGALADRYGAGRTIVACGRVRRLPTSGHATGLGNDCATMRSALTLFVSRPLTTMRASFCTGSRQSDPNEQRRASTGGGGLVFHSSWGQL